MIYICNNIYDFKSKKDYLSSQDYSIESEILNDPYGSIYVFPTRRFSRYIQKKHISECGKKGLSSKSIQISNLFDLAFSIVKKYSSNTELVDEQKRFFILSDILDSHSSNLQFFNKKNTISNTSNLLELVSNLRDNGVLSDSIITRDLPEGESKNRIVDIKYILNVYESEVNKKNSSEEDTFSIFTKACAFIRDKPEILAEFIDKDIVSSGFFRFKDYEIGFIRSLLTHSPKGVRLGIAFDRKNHRLFRSINQLVEKITDSLDLNTFEIQKGNQHQQYISQNLFQKVNEPPKYPESCFSLIECESKADEVKKVSKLIRYHYDQGIPLNRMIVVSNSSKDYSSMVREIFALEKIPTNITDRFILSGSPVVNSIISLIEAVLAGFPKRSILSLSKNKYLNFKELSINSATDLAEALHVYKIQSFAKYLNRKSKNETNSNTTNNYNRLDLLSNEIYKKKFQVIISSLTTLYSELRYGTNSDGSQKISVNDFQRYLNRVIKFTKLIDNVLSIRGSLKTTNKHEHTLIRHELEKDSQAFNEFISLIAGFPEYFDRPDKQEHTLSDLLSKFKILLTLTRYQIKEIPDYGINVTSIEQSRELDFDIAFVLGMDEGVTPSRNSGTEPSLELVFSDSVRQKYEYEKLLFYNLLTNQRNYQNAEKDRFYFTYTKGSGDNNNISHFLLKVKELFKADECFKQYTLADINNLEIISDDSSATDDIRIILKSRVTSLSGHDKLFFSSDELSHEKAYEAYLKSIGIARYSASKLEKYLNCKLSYLFGQVLEYGSKYYENDDTVFSSGKDKGDIYHAIFEIICKELFGSKSKGNVDLQKLKSQQQKVTGMSEEEILNFIDDIIDNIIESISSTVEFPEYEANSKKPIIKEYILNLINEESGFIPAYVEYSIESKLSYSTENELHKNSDTEFEPYDIIFKATIDRVDVIPDDINNMVMRVVDYKTGSKPVTPLNILKNSKDAQKNIQLGLYAYLADNHINFDTQANFTEDRFRTEDILVEKVGFNLKENATLFESHGLDKRSKAQKTITKRDHVLEIEDDSLTKVGLVIDSLKKFDFKKEEYKSCSFCPHPELCKKRASKQFS